MSEPNVPEDVAVGSSGVRVRLVAPHYLNGFRTPLLAGKNGELLEATREGVIVNSDEAEVFASEAERLGIGLTFEDVDTGTMISREG